MKKTFPLFIIFFILCFTGNAQQYYKFDDFSIKPFEKEIYKTDSLNNFHTSVKPFTDIDISKIPKSDSVSDILKNKKTKTLGGRILFNEPLIKFDKKKFYFDFNIPQFTGKFYYDYREKQNTFESGIGGEFNFKYSDKLALFADLTYNYSIFPLFIQDKIENTKVVPGQGFANNSYIISAITNPHYRNFEYNNYNYYLSYNIYKHFNFQLGQGKNFFGDGYRSMLLS
ncbi:MAG: hypothetical protein PHD97_11630, partial [Bacteroidales bacterium]|nr:hypothetical protein [Bacteroidales bacterium]